METIYFTSPHYHSFPPHYCCSNRTHRIYQQISIEEKALFFTERVEGFPTSVVFCYRYLPQMIVVALGVGWAAVDLDVKRLEPYFQLSKPEGATASNSIFLHYPFDFIAFVPINAARKGCVIGVCPLHLRNS